MKLLFMESLALVLELRSGDMIFVNPAENIVGIYGGVKRPGQYELKDDDSIEELIFFANGFLHMLILMTFKLKNL